MNVIEQARCGVIFVELAVFVNVTVALLVYLHIDSHINSYCRKPRLELCSEIVCRIRAVIQNFHAMCFCHYARHLCRVRVHDCYKGRELHNKVTTYCNPRTVSCIPAGSRRGTPTKPSSDLETSYSLEEPLSFL